MRRWLAGAVAAMCAVACSDDTSSCYERCLQEDEFFEVAKDVFASLVSDCQGERQCTCAVLSNPGVSCRVKDDGDVVFSANSNMLEAVVPLGVFPADAQGNRVCGPGGSISQLEVPFALQADKPPGWASHPNDRQVGYAEGERIELRPLLTAGAKATVLAKDFRLEAACMTEEGAAAACSSSLATEVTATAIRYAPVAARLDPQKPTTWHNVAVIVDHSGSTFGLVDGTTLREYSLGSPILPPSAFSLLRSDPYDDRVHAAQDFLDGLSPGFDRSLAYFYDERVGVEVACSDAKVCIGDPEAKKCLMDKDCGEDGPCVEDPTQNADTFLSMTSIAEREDACFGNKASHREWARLGLSLRAKLGGEGRAPLWTAIDRAVTFLRSRKGLNGPKHVVVLTDGPDTCTHGEAFTWKDLSGKTGKCTKPCETATADFQAFVAKAEAAKWPVIVHVVQFQAPGYPNPDPHLQEVACRSGGTYQFLRTLDLVRDDPTAWSTTFHRALQGVRLALSGTWRATFPLAAPLPAGQALALSAEFRWTPAKFASVPVALELTDHWKMTQHDGHDRRASMHVPCTTDASCGGSGPCADNRCGVDGLCRPKAPDQLPCPGGVCCDGQCLASCANCK